MSGEHRIEITELVLSLPDVTREDAPSLVDEVLRRVQDRLRGCTRRGNVHLAELTVRVPPGGGRDALIGAIADALEGALR
ncbi:MAG: hypothetical protein HOV81_00970 [Kofleriaceae bacterium]|nr:hypothetical protein [Kofleriaceae bacterium]